MGCGQSKDTTGAAAGNNNKKGKVIMVKRKGHINDKDKETNHNDYSERTPNIYNSVPYVIVSTRIPYIKK